jgi:class 3 adenylate cyclase
MSGPAADVERRKRQALLADIRQRLQAPVSGLVGYGEVLHQEATRLALMDVLPDLDRISQAAGELSDMVDRMLDDDHSRQLSRTGDVSEAEKMLRHDLRNPLNAIKGYSELLLEELEDGGRIEIRADLEKLLGESNRLLAQLDDIVSFARDQSVTRTADAGQSALSTSVAAFLEDTRSLADEDLTAEETGRILVVDDIESNRDLLARRLETDGHRVTVAADGEQALEILKEQEFDLVLLDLMMPGLSGFDVLQRLKIDSELRDIPVIMISALDETDSVIRCIEAGADDYLPKPFNPILLKARIRSGLEKKQWSDSERQQRKFIRQAFARFISPAVVDQLVSDPSRLSLGGERKDLTCIFTDLAGFTTLIENLEPPVVLPLLNRYLDGLCKIVLEHDGTIDKIVGDALHAFFGAPVEQLDHPQRAMTCALALAEFADDFANQEIAVELGFGHTRIGVHSGVAVVGNFGGDSFFDYTAHGDVVNSAARLETANKPLGTRTCVSGATASRCPNIEFRPVGKLLLKGKAQEIEAFEPFPKNDSRRAPPDEYDKAFALLQDGKPSALAAFMDLQRAYPEDPLAAFHAKRLSAGESGTVINLDSA